MEIKGFVDDFGLDWSDYGASYYDPQVARFLSVDPLAESYNFQSPYVYAANNPILYFDKNGMNSEEDVDTSPIKKLIEKYRKIKVIEFQVGEQVKFFP